MIRVIKLYYRIQDVSNWYGPFADAKESKHVHPVWFMADKNWHLEKYNYKNILYIRPRKTFFWLEKKK